MFETHKLNQQGIDSVKQFKESMSATMTLILPTIPDGREKAIFQTKIEEAVFFATKAIASKEGNFTEIISF